MKSPMYVVTAALCMSAVCFTCSNVSAQNQPAAKTDGSYSQKLEANKKLVTTFYQALMGDKDSTAIDKYVDDNIKQHNPMFQDGKEWLKSTLRPFLENPNIQKTKVDIVHIAADGDMVWLHVRDVAPNGKVYARVGIYKVANGKIVEAWKVAEAVPAKSAMENSPF